MQPDPLNSFILERWHGFRCPEKLEIRAHLIPLPVGLKAFSDQGMSIKALV